MRVHVNAERCDGYGDCEVTAPRAFKLLHEGGPVSVLFEGDVPEDYEGAVIRAVERCPKLALWLDPDPFAD